MMAVLTIISVSVFAQVSTNNQKKITKQNSEKMKYTCPMHHDMVMDNLDMCQNFGSPLNLSLKEKMKREGMKIDVSLMNNKARITMPCNLSKGVTVINLSPKEKMKWEAMRISNSHLNTTNTCSMMNVLTSNEQISCFYYRFTLNLSPKEKMKREVMKI